MKGKQKAKRLGGWEAMKLGSEEGKKLPARRWEAVKLGGWINFSVEKFMKRSMAAQLISFTLKIGADSFFYALKGVIVETSIMPYYNAFIQSKNFVKTNPTKARQLP